MKVVLRSIALDAVVRSKPFRGICDGNAIKCFELFMVQ